MTDLSQTKMPERGFYEHVERPGDAPLGVRTVEFLNLAHSKDGPTLAIYRPLDPEVPVYKAGKRWDYKPLEEFLERYQLVTGLIHNQQLAKLRDQLYAD